MERKKEKEKEERGGITPRETENPLRCESQSTANARERVKGQQRRE